MSLRSYAEPPALCLYPTATWKQVRERESLAAWTKGRLKDKQPELVFCYWTEESSSLLQTRSCYFCQCMYHKLLKCCRLLIHFLILEERTAYTAPHILTQRQLHLFASICWCLHLSIVPCIISTCHCNKCPQSPTAFTWRDVEVWTAGFKYISKIDAEK